MGNEMNSRMMDDDDHRCDCQHELDQEELRRLRREPIPALRVEDTMRFQHMRSELAMQYIPSKDELTSMFAMDMERNRHGDYGKPERRSGAQITSDLKFKYADDILLRQYGEVYRNWLKNNGYVEDTTSYRGFRLQRRW